MVDKIFKIFMGLVFVLIIIVAVIQVIGCQSAPDKKEYKVEECYVFCDCLYRNNKNPDKSSCAMLAEACRDSLKELRAISRFEYCKKNIPAGMTEETCRLTLERK